MEVELHWFLKPACLPISAPRRVVIYNFTMINVNQLRNNTAFEIEGQPYLVINYQFTKMGRGTGNIKVKCRNLKTGTVANKTFGTGSKVQEISLNKKELQFLYTDKDRLIFMDPVTFEQTEIERELVKEQKKYFVEEMKVEVLFWNQEALGVELPLKMVYEIKETGPGEKGNSAANIYKPAVLSNGLAVKVPLFIKVGDKVKIDTRSGEYISRL